jgi:hypothetical protein
MRSASGGSRTPWAVNRTPMTYRSISAHDRTEFSRKPILFVGISDNHFHSFYFLNVCFLSAHLKLPLSVFDSKICGSNSQWEVRIRCGMAFWSPLSMVQLIRLQIGGHLGNGLASVWLRRSQLPGLSSVSVCRSLLLCLSIVSVFIPRRNSWIKSRTIGKSREVKRFIYWGLCMHVLNLSSRDQIPLGCPNFSKSISSRELIPRTCLQMMFDVFYLTAPNRPVLIDLFQSTQGEEKE